MAATGTTYTIDVPVKAAEAVKAAHALTALESSIKAATAASSAAAEAVRAAEGAHKQAVSTYDAAAKAVERIGVMADAQKGKLEKAMKAGDEKAFWRAAQAIQDLNARQDEARSKADAAKAALDNATTSLDSLRAAAASAAAEKARFASEAEAASARASEAARALAEAERAQAAASAATNQQLIASQRALGDAVAARVAKSIADEKKQQSAAEATMKALKEQQDQIRESTVSNMAKSAAQTAALREKIYGTGKSNEAAEAFSKLGGPVGMLGQKIFDLREGYGKLKTTFGDRAPYIAAASGIGAVVAVLVAVSLAAVVAVASFGAWAVSLANTARSQGLLSAGIAKSAAGGEILQSKIDSLTNRLPVTSDELRSMASNLAATGLRGAALASELEIAATKAAKLKFGPEFRREMFSVEQLSKRLTLGVSKIFGGLKIEGLLAQLSNLVDLFQENSATANAIKVVFESFFQPAVDGLEGFIPKVVAGFIQLQIWALQGLIAIKPYGFVFREAASYAELIGVNVAIAFGVIVAMGASAAIQVGLLFAAIKWVRDGVIEAKNAIASLGETLAAIDLGQVGIDMMAGLANGIANGGSLVVSGMKSAAEKAVNAAKSALGIASPSRVLAAEVGQHIPGGIAMGIDDASGDIVDATQAAVDQTTSVAPSGAPATAGASSGGVTISGNTFVFHGVAGAEDAEGRFTQLFFDLVSGKVSLGGEPVPNGA